MYLKLLIFLLAILILEFHMMYSAYKLNKAGWQYTALMYSFPNSEPVCFMSGSNCCFFSCKQVSLEAGKVVWYSRFLENFQSVVTHTVKGFSLVSEAEADFLFSIALFFLWSSIRWHLISSYPAFSKPSLYIWKVSVHMLLKSSLKDFEHNLAGCEMNAWSWGRMRPRSRGHTSLTTAVGHLGATVCHRARLPPRGQGHPKAFRCCWSPWGRSATAAGSTHGTGGTGHYPPPTSVSGLIFLKLLPKPAMPLQAAAPMSSGGGLSAPETLAPPCIAVHQGPGRSRQPGPSAAASSGLAPRRLRSGRPSAVGILHEQHQGRCWSILRLLYTGC